MRGWRRPRVEKHTPNKHVGEQDTLSIVRIMLIFYYYQQQLRKLTLSDTFFKLSRGNIWATYTINKEHNGTHGSGKSLGVGGEDTVARKYCMRKEAIFNNRGKTSVTLVSGVRYLLQAFDSTAFITWYTAIHTSKALIHTKWQRKVKVFILKCNYRGSLKMGKTFMQTSIKWK